MSHNGNGANGAGDQEEKKENWNPYTDGTEKKGGYLIVPRWVFANLDLIGLSPGAQNLLMKMAFHKKNFNWTYEFPSGSVELSKETGVNRVKIPKYLEQMEAAKIISEKDKETKKLKDRIKVTPLRALNHYIKNIKDQKIRNKIISEKDQKQDFVGNIKKRLKQPNSLPVLKFLIEKHINLKEISQLAWENKIKTIDVLATLGGIYLGDSDGSLKLKDPNSFIKNIFLHGKTYPTILMDEEFISRNIELEDFMADYINQFEKFTLKEALTDLEISNNRNGKTGYCNEPLRPM
jgi:hypothetical protein